MSTERDDGSPCLIETTYPSDYDTSTGWYCTIGKSEYEHWARLVTTYLQRHGDEWIPVFHDSVYDFAERNGLGLTYMRHSWWIEMGLFFMPEAWLEAMQRVRVPRQGPPHLRYYDSPWLSQGPTLGFEWPNGRRQAASHTMTGTELTRLVTQTQAQSCTS